MKRVITAQDVPAGGDLRIPEGSIVTPTAREVAASRGVRILELPEDQLSALAPPERTLAIGADHGGYRMKEALKPVIESLGLQVRDVGVTEEKPADYPDIALQVAELVAVGHRLPRRHSGRRRHRFVHRGQQGSGHPRGLVL